MPAIWQTTERMYKTCSKSVLSTGLLYFIAKSIDIEDIVLPAIKRLVQEEVWSTLLYYTCDYLCCWIRRSTPLERCLIWWCGWTPWTTTCASIGCTGEFEQATWIEDGQRSVKTSVCMTGIHQLFQSFSVGDNIWVCWPEFGNLRSSKTLVSYWILHKLIAV